MTVIGRESMLARFSGLAAAFLLLAGAVIAHDSPDVEFHPGREGLPFAEAVRVGDLLFLSGEIGVMPGTLELAKGGIRAEARQTMKNIGVTLEKHGLGMSDLVKCTVMLADMSEWDTFNEAYREFFESDAGDADAPGGFRGRFPARSAFGADGLALGARVEVECIAAGRPGAGRSP